MKLERFVKLINKTSAVILLGGGGGSLPIQKGGNACRKIRKNTLKIPNLQILLPKRNTSMVSKYPKNTFDVIKTGTSMESEAF